MTARSALFYGGDPGKHGILGDRIPKPFQPDGRRRVFYTQQHGENVTYEVTRPASPH